MLQTALCADAAAATVRLGVLGDSNSDEYRADDNRGGAYALGTLNWVEILDRLRDVDVGPWGTRSEPRRSGNEYNWARSGAKADDLASQQSGLAQQVREGKVEYVVVFIGSNDFHPESTYREVYDGTVSGAALQRKIDGIIADIRSAVQAVVSAGAKVILVSVPDIGIHPVNHVAYPDPARRQIVTNAINTINATLRADSDADPNVVYSDGNAVYQTLSTRFDAQGNLIVGGERINMLQRGNEPHHLQLDDYSGHAGTVLNGLFANLLIAAPLNQNFGTAIPELTDQEILCVAGIVPAGGCSSSRPKPPVLSIE
jgi:hypothetical protein